MVKSRDSGDRNTFKCGHNISTIEGIQWVVEIAHASIVISEDGRAVVECHEYCQWKLDIALGSENKLAKDAQCENYGYKRDWA